ncbi:MAG TPA: PilN domain-containing protein [Gammaproteobacteria bacterium]
MAHINLLPWREELRKQRKRDFFIAIGSAAFAMVLVVIALHFYYSALIDNEESRISYMQAEIKSVEAKIKEIDELEKKKAQLIARMQVIDQLQKNRPEVVHMFDELVRLVPEGMTLTNMVQKDRMITLEGDAQSNARVSALMRALDASEWFADPVLDVIKASSGKGESAQTFKLRVQQKTIQGEVVQGVTAKGVSAQGVKK